MPRRGEPSRIYGTQTLNGTMESLVYLGPRNRNESKADVVPGLEGEFVNIRESSAKMSVSRMASLIEYVTAYGVANGVKFNDRWGFCGR